MRSPWMTIVAWLLSSAVLMAQPNTQSTTAPFLSGLASESCPVDLFVGRMTAPVETGSKAATSSRFGLGLEMNLARSGAAKMVKATVTNADRTDTIQLRRAADLLSSAVWLRRMSAVSWVDRTEIEFADGSTWTLRISLNVERVHLNLCRSLAQ
jgi:hypothetical protein